MVSPVDRLNDAVKQFPQISSMVEQCLMLRGRDLPDWPDWCFVPMAAWYSIATAGKDRITPVEIFSTGVLAAIGTWRYSQGIYRIDPELQAALIDTPMSGDLPTELFYQLPEWSMYIETPGMDWMAMPMSGFWAHLDYDQSGRGELRLLVDTGESLIPIPIDLNASTLDESYSLIAGRAEEQARRYDLSFKSDPAQRELIVENVKPLLSLVLYLASEEPDIDPDANPGINNARPALKRTRKGFRLFPAQGPTVYKIGETIGEALRESLDVQRKAQELNPERTVRPHLRRAHWHSFWVGPRDGERKLTCKWLPPKLVKAEPESDMKPLTTQP